MKNKKQNGVVHFRQGQWSKDIGDWIGRSGKPTPRRFYFGTDKAEAERLAELIKAEWRVVKLRGGTVWPVEMLTKFELMMGGLTDAEAKEAAATPLPATTTPSVAPNATGTVSDGKTLYAKMQEYLEASNARRDIGPEHKGNISDFNRMIQRFLPDMPLCELDRKTLATFISTVASRPPTIRRGASGPISLDTVKGIVRHFRMFLSHLEDGEWSPGCNWRRVTRLKFSKLEDEDAEVEAENEDDTVDTFTVDELRMIWNRAPERLRLYILLGLNCGMTQKEISTLKYRQCHLDDAEPFIRRLRNKTKGVGGGTKMRWTLWDETLTLLTKHLAPDNGSNPKKRLALLNKYNKPLIFFSDNPKNKDKQTRHDAVAAAWTRTVDSTLRDRRPRKNYLTLGGESQPRPREEPIVALTFKYLRKTGINWIKQQERYGPVVADAYCQHKELGEISKYSNPMYKRVKNATTAFRKYLQPMFQDSPSPLRLTVHEMIVTKLDPPKSRGAKGRGVVTESTADLILD